MKRSSLVLALLIAVCAIAVSVLALQCLHGAHGDQGFSTPLPHSQLQQSTP
jgi:energy-converting hydrogenase Eha subunit F